MFIVYTCANLHYKTCQFGFSALLGNLLADAESKCLCHFDLRVEHDI